MTDTEDSPHSERYLFVVSYEEDAERKRAEYLFNNWEGGDIKPPDGFVRIAADVDHDRLYEKLVGKIPPEQVRSFRLEPVDADVSRDRHTVEETVSAPADTVESFLEYILSKKKAVLQSGTRNEYEIYSKKGRAEVSYHLSEADGNTTVVLHVEGYPPAPEYLAGFFETELTDYARSQE
jgi:hypothetical protein